MGCIFPTCSPARKKNNEAADEIEETAQEKKLRLAKLYLEQLRQQGEMLDML